MAQSAVVRDYRILEIGRRDTKFSHRTSWRCELDSEIISQRDDQEVDHEDHFDSNVRDSPAGGARPSRDAPTLRRDPRSQGARGEAGRGDLLLPARLTHLR